MDHLSAVAAYCKDFQNSAQLSSLVSIWVAAMTAFDCCPDIVAIADFKLRSLSEHLKSP